jgi:hypothetical protein
MPYEDYLVGLNRQLIVNLKCEAENIDKYPVIQPDVEQLRNEAYSLEIMALNGDSGYYNQLGRVTLLMDEISLKLSDFKEYKKSLILFNIF